MLTIALRIFWRADIPAFPAILPVFHAIRKFLSSRDYVLSTIVVLGMWLLRVAAGLQGSQAPSTFAQPRQFYESGMSLNRKRKGIQATSSNSDFKIMQRQNIRMWFYFRSTPKGETKPKELKKVEITDFQDLVQDPFVEHKQRYHPTLEKIKETPQSIRFDN